LPRTPRTFNTNPVAVRDGSTHWRSLKGDLAF